MMIKQADSEKYVAPDSIFSVNIIDMKNVDFNSSFTPLNEDADMAA